LKKIGISLKKYQLCQLQLGSSHFTRYAIRIKKYDTDRDGVQIKASCQKRKEYQ
jgi:hypothetical protein